MKLYKTTMIIWSPYDPGHSLSVVAFDAENGDSFCSRKTTELIKNVEEDPDWVQTEFFNS